jgi:DNA-binding beta-propeller fold protein YncE
MVLAGTLALSCDAGAWPAPAATATPVGAPRHASGTPLAAADAPAATPIATPTPPAEWFLPRPDGEVAVLLADWGPRAGWEPGRPGAGRAALLPLHPESAEDLSGYVPIDIGHHYDAAVSPDGGLLAIARGPTQEGNSRIFEVIDLETWEVRGFEGAPRGLSVAAWDPGGARVYAQGADCSEPLSEGRCGSPWIRQLWAISVDSGAVELLAAHDFWITSTHVAPDGERLYALAHRTDVCCGIGIEEPPFVAVIEAKSGKVLGEIPLPEVITGQRWETLLDDQPEYNILRTPGVALAPGGDRLYIAHAGEDRVTVVNLERLTVEQVADVSPPRSALSRLGTWLAGHLVSRAEAKSALYQRKQATVSPDGGYLYITGSADLPCHEQADFACTSHPLGLSIVDTESMRVLQREPDVSSFTLTPDGRRLLAIGFLRDYLTEEEDRTVGYGLKILDAETLDRIAHIWPGAVVSVGAVSPDGRYAYLLSNGDGREVRADDPRRCETDCRRITVVDIEAGQAIATRMMDGTTIDLISLGASPGPAW